MGMTASDSRFACRSVRAAWLGLGLALALPAGAAVYVCTDASGRRHTADRPIAACSDREQRVLNADGSLNRIVPPAVSDQQRVLDERRRQELERERTLRTEAAQRDRSLLRRYPDERAHQAARASALHTVTQSIEATQRRIEALQKERKPLNDEASFYEGKPLPVKLKRQFDANDAAMQAQRALVQNQEIESKRIHAMFDAELERLRALWKGMPPGAPEPARAASR
jgi:hypothetical protein